MKLTTVKTKILLIVMLVAIEACNALPPTSVLPITEPVTAAPATPVTGSAPEASAPPAVSMVQHEFAPANLPGEESNQARDFDSSTATGKKPVIGGDRFTFGLLERPFNADTMDVYYPQLDIVGTLIYQDETWIYGIVAVKELTASSSQNEKYAVEFDTDLDGKGDWLIVSYKPASTDWTVVGVKVHWDANKDVGGQYGMFADKNPPNSDGYETLIFDEGQGDDPDTAWVRISPNDPNAIEFAIKMSALGSPARFMVNMWAGTSLLDPALFEINDRFTHEQAGAADPGFEFFYPIKGVAEIDNSCRMAVGFQPTGREPGICNASASVQSDNSDDSDDSESGSGSEYGSGSESGESCTPCPEGYYQNPDCSCYQIIN